MNYIDKFKLNKTISLVTGGAGGIGTEVCKSLLDAGSRVILADINSKKSEKLINKLNNKYIEFYKLDSTSEESLHSLSKFIIKKYKRLDILINCIGICFNEKAEKVGYGGGPGSRSRKCVKTEGPGPSKCSVSLQRGCKNQEIQGP